MIKNRLPYVLLDKETNMNELAEKSGVPYSTIWRFNKMQSSTISFDTLNAICEALDVQPGDLLEYVPDKEPARE